MPTINRMGHEVMTIEETHILMVSRYKKINWNNKLVEKIIKGDY